MTLGLFLFAAVDAQAKFLTGSMHLIQIVWTRQLGLLIGVTVLLALRAPSIMQSNAPYLKIARGFVATFSATMFVLGVNTFH